jgi:hypothetical protein
MTKEDIDKFILKMYKDMEWGLIPTHMWPGVKEYLEFGTLQGDFLRSIIIHDFYNAIFRADHMNQACIVGWAQFLCWHMPMDCHGTVEKYNSWHLKGGLRGILSDKAAAA